MTQIALQDGKVILRDGKAGTGQDCCCGCQCGTYFTLDGSNVYKLKFTFGDSSTATYCLNALPLPLGGTAENLICVGQRYEVLVKPGNCNVKLFFTLGNFPDCDCETGDSCDYLLDGWENAVGCSANDSVTDITNDGNC